MRSQTVKPQFAENVVIRIQNQNKAVEAAKKAHEQAKQTLDDFLRDAAGRRGREGDWGPGSDNSTRENSMRGEVIQRKQQMELAEAELSRLEGIASIGWAGLSVLVAVKAKAAAIDAAKTQLAEELSEAEAEVEALDEQIKEAELQLALRAEFSQGTSSDDDLTGVVAERDEASKRAESLRKRLMAYRADSPGLGRQLGIATPATELEKLTSELRAEVETVRAKAVEDAAEAQTRFDAL